MGLLGLKAVGACSGARYHMRGDSFLVQMAKRMAPTRHIAKSSTNMKTIILSIWYSILLRLEGGSVAFFITCAGE